ncbi:MAG TPA: hypothetical protein ACFCUD_02495 [Cyclobacteriaceae bacterium]
MINPYLSIYLKFILVILVNFDTHGQGDKKNKDTGVIINQKALGNTGLFTNEIEVSDSIHIQLPPNSVVIQNRRVINVNLGKKDQQLLMHDASGILQIISSDALTKQIIIRSGKDDQKGSLLTARYNTIYQNYWFVILIICIIFLSGFLNARAINLIDLLDNMPIVLLTIVNILIIDLIFHLMIPIDRRFELLMLGHDTDIIISLIKTSVIIGIFFLAKYLVISLLTLLFNLRNLLQEQYQTFNKYIFFINTFFLLLLIAFWQLDIAFVFNLRFLSSLYFIAVLVSSLAVVNIFLKKYSYNNIYLFSYFCTSEIFSLFIVFKLFYFS